MNRVPLIQDRIPVRRVLLSVSDKRGLETIVPLLASLPDVIIYSTGGTFRAIESILGPESGVLKRVSEYTGQPETQGGLVKTLDFRIYLGLLSEPFNADHAMDRRRTGAELIDMVIVNLYPFAEVSGREDADAEDARSNIDIGGPTMLRAAAKSYLRVAPICNPDDYPLVIRELEEHDGTTGFSLRYRLAGSAFAHTAAYDSAIAAHFQNQDPPAALAPYEVDR